MSARRRAEQFATAVDGSAPVDDLPADLRDLVEMVTAVRSVPAPEPRPEFSASLRELLMAEAEAALTPVSPLVLPPRRSGARERRLTAAAAVFTLVGGTAGIAAAAQQSLPGEALYPIKRGIEDIALSVQSGADDRGRTYLDQARARLDEAERLVDEEPEATAAVAETVEEFAIQSVAGADLLLASYGDERTGDDVEVLRTFAADTLARLQVLVEAAPTDTHDELARAAVVLRQIDQQAAAACAACSDLPLLEMPVLMAQVAEISRAMEAVRTQAPNNDHPALEQPQAPRTSDRDEASTSADGGTPETPDGDGSGGTGSGDVGPGVGADVDAPGGLPISPDPQKILEDINKATGGLVVDVTKEPTKQVDNLEDQVQKGIDDTLEGTGLVD